MGGQLSSEPEELACFTAFYKLWQNAGAFASFLFVFIGDYYVDYWVNISLLLMLVLPTVLAIRRATSIACDSDSAKGIQCVQSIEGAEVKGSVNVEVSENISV